MTDPTLPSASRRFASLLDREFCFWMPSPSVALLSVLVTAKERPKRLLGPEDLPAFASNIGRVAGAATVGVTGAGIDDVLNGLMDDGLTPGQIWGVALHREGKLSPTDWLSSCAALKVPTVELCLGSLASLAQWGRSPATFTIVDLDAEAPFSGVRLTAVLTSERALAARIQHLCLPGPEARDYILDANPRGLAQDEPDLLSIVEDAAARFGGKAGDSGALPGRALAWLRRITSAESAPSPQPGGLPRWSARLAELEAHHAEVLRTAAAFADSLKARLEQQSTSAAEWERRCVEAERTAASRGETIDLWESRFNDAEAEAEKDAAVLSTVRIAAAKQRDELERALSSLKAERDTLEQDLGRSKEEHAAALRQAAASEQRITGELGQRIRELEQAAAMAAEREVKEAEAAESMRTRLQAQADRLETDAGAAKTERVGLLSALASLKGEREALEQTLARTKEEHLQASKNAAVSEQRVTTELRQRIAQLEEATGSERAGLEDGLASMKAEREALERQITRAEQDHTLALRNAAASEMRITIELRQRIKELEEAAAVSAGREAKQAQAAEAERTGLEKALASTKAERDALAQKAVKTEQDHVLALRSAASSEMRVSIELRQRVKELEEAMQAAKETAAGLLKAKAETERSLAASEEGKKALDRKLVELDAELGEALAETARRSAEQRGTLEEQTRRASRLEAEVAAQVAALTAREAEKTTLLGRLAEGESKSGRAAAESAERERALQSALETQRLRVKELEAAATALQDREAKGIAEERSSKAALEEQVRRLEADAVLVQQSFAVFRDEKKAVDRALAQAHTDLLSATEKLGAAEASRAALEEHKERLVGQAQAWATEKAELSERITRLEALVVEAQEGRTPLQSELGVLREKLAAAEGARDEALLDAERRGETLRAALEEQTQRLEQSRKDTAVLNVREARQAEAFSAERAALSDRIARVEAMALEAKEAHESALAQKKLIEQEIASVRAESAAVAKQLAETEMARDIALAAAKRREEAQRSRAEELEHRAEMVTREAEAATEREARQAEAREASRADLVVRIARLEEAEVASEKARAELLERKRETDRALAAAQVEIAALMARPVAAGVAPQKPAPARGPAPPAEPENGAKPVNTGGFSALLNVLQTSVIQRPSQPGSQPEAPDRPKDFDLNQPFEFEATPAAAPPSNPAPAPVRESPAKPPEAVSEPSTGGFSALLDRLTGRTRRPRPSTPDEAEKLDGWLRDRKRGKD